VHGFAEGRFIKKFRKVIAVFITASMILGCAAVANAQQITLSYDGSDHIYTAAPVSLVVNGRLLTDLPMPPVVIDNYTLAPVREIFESLGATVDWNPNTQEVYIDYGGNDLVMQIDSPVATLNGQYMQMDVPPKIINGKTMIPVRFPSEALGFDVEWDSYDRTVSVSTPDYLTQSEILDPGTIPVVQSYAPPAAPAPPDAVLTSGGTADDNQNDIGQSMTPGAAASSLAKDISTQDIPAENDPQTKLTGLSVPADGSPVRYTVTADGPISKVEKMLLPDNRLVLDFYNAECGLSAQYPSGNGIVSQVRTAQNQVTPAMITRVVFDLTTNANYAVTISGDRKSVTVSFERTVIQAVSFAQSGYTDTVSITGDLQPGMDIYPLSNPSRLIVDMPLATMGQIGAVAASGNFVSSIDAQQLDANTARVTIGLKSDAKYSLTYNGATAVITLSDATVHNISYDRDSHTLTIGKNGSGLAAGGISQTDLYNSYRYVLTFPGDYSGIYGDGDYAIKDQYLDGVTVATSNGVTTLTINEKQVFAYNISETADAIQITPVNPKSKYSKIVIIDPGHGGSDPGAQGWGLNEKDVVLDISQRLMQLISADGSIKAYATRISDVCPDLYDRPAWGSQLGDIFVSIHMNSTESNFAATGTEVHYSGDNDRTVNGFNSEKLANIMLDNITSALGTNKRSVVEDDLVVCKCATIPSVLCEMGFISNQQEAGNFGAPDYRQRAAQALYQGILAAFGVYTPGR